MGRPPAEMLRAARVLALRAGQGILRHWRAKGVAFAAKADSSPLTAADVEADRLIVRGLNALDSSIPCVSEESPVPAYSVRRSWRRFWLVDPLDGTKEFLAHRDDFTVNIALIEDGEPVLGVVYAPVKRWLYYACKGQGARKRVGSKAPRRILSRAPRSGGVVVVESRSHPSERLEAFLKTLPVARRLQIGSSLKFCLLAEGRADVYPRFGPTNEWDTAAGDCIFRNSAPAGVRASPLRYNKPKMRNGDFVLGLPWML